MKMNFFLQVYEKNNIYLMNWNNIVGANWSHRYYSRGKGIDLWPNIQFEDKSVSEDDQQRKWILFYRKR